MRFRNCRRWLLAICSSVIVAYASIGTSAASSPAGSTKLVLAKYGFSVSLPPGWQKVTLTRAGINKIAKNLHRVDPTFYQQFVNNEASVRHLQLYAIGPPQGASLPNVNVLVQSPQGLPSGKAFLTQVQPVMKSDLQQAGVKNATFSVVHLPFGPAVQGVYTLPGTSTTVTQLYISHKGHLYIVSMSPPSVVAQIESSWHWQ
jgi:hypothetical protein